MSPSPPRRGIARLLPRRLRLLPLLASLIALVVVAGVIGAAARGSGSAPTRTITAVFAQAPGLYAGNKVDVLGMPVGTITHITPGTDGVTVVMQVDRSVDIPAGASAVLDAPQVVNDRSIELTPAYSGGPKMLPGAVIPTSRTSYPLSVDAVLGDLDSLLTALGPTATADKGVLNGFITSLNTELNGQGRPLHDAIANASSAASALADDSPELTSTLTQLSSFVTTLSSADDSYTQFTSTLAQATGDLDAERGQLSAALSTLQQTLAQVTAFVRQSGPALSGTLAALNAAAAATATQQQHLGQLLQLLPTLGQNLGNLVTTDANGGNHQVIQARVSLPAGSQALIQQICGSTLQRNGQLIQEQTKAPVLDGVCSFAAASTSLTPPPGAPQLPDMSIAALLQAANS